LVDEKAEKLVAYQENDLVDLMVDKKVMMMDFSMEF
jgi:hypothetical protein